MFNGYDRKANVMALTDTDVSTDWRKRKELSLALGVLSWGIRKIPWLSTSMKARTITYMWEELAIAPLSP